MLPVKSLIVLHIIYCSCPILSKESNDIEGLLGYTGTLEGTIDNHKLETRDGIIRKETPFHNGNISDDDELRLINHILGRYNKEVRPVKNISDAVQISFDIAYTQLIDLDEKNQVLISNFWIRIRWFNYLLTWNKDNFGGIESVNISPEKLWLPDIVLSDNAQEILGSGLMDQYKMKVIVNYTGLTRWYFPTILKSRCGIDVNLFPFDDQKCELTFLSWAYNGYQINITNRYPQADLKSYLKSGEFELISARAVRKVVFYNCCAEPFPQVKYTIHIRRKALFYMNNLIIPCFFITALGLFTFLLPPTLGERVTLLITALLAMTVFMLTIAESTPSSSDSTPLIGKIIIASTAIISLSLIATCLVLNLHECTKSVNLIPRWIQVIILNYAVPFLWISPPHKRSIMTKMSSSSSTTMKKYLKIEGNVITVEETKAKRNNDDIYVSIGISKLSDITQGDTAVLPSEVSDGFSILAERAKDQVKLDTISDDWQLLAKFSNRFFLFVFLSTLSITGIYMFVKRPDVPTL